VITFPLPNNAVLVVIEPGNIKRLKEGQLMRVGPSLVVFTPDLKKFIEALGIDLDLPGPGEYFEKMCKITPEQIAKAVLDCKDLPEVDR
jgi:hypothetical protein